MPGEKTGARMECEGNAAGEIGSPFIGDGQKAERAHGLDEVARLRLEVKQLRSTKLLK